MDLHDCGKFKLRRHRSAAGWEGVGNCRDYARPFRVLPRNFCLPCADVCDSFSLAGLARLRGPINLAAVSLIVLLLCCGACSRRWTCVRGVYPAGGTCDCVATEAPIAGHALAERDCPAAGAPPRSGAAGPAAELSDGLEPNGPSRNSAPDTPASTSWPGLLERGTAGQSQLAAAPPVGGRWLERSAETTPDPDSLLLERPSAWRSAGGPRGGGRFKAMLLDIRTDHRNYYSWPSMRKLLLGVAASSVFANTSMDEDIQDWYQDDVRSSGTDDFSSFWKASGRGQVLVPACVGLALVGRMFEDRPLGCATGQFATRVTRGYLVGGPPVMLMQHCLGSSRPGESPHESAFRPFEDANAVSGHAFIGAMPFITAAKMTEDPCLKGCLYFCSILPAWSRVNDDCHYFSQVYLGWWMAYLAAAAVSNTERDQRQLAFTPLVAPGTVGVEVVYRR